MPILDCTIGDNGDALYIFHTSYTKRQMHSRFIYSWLETNLQQLKLRVCSFRSGMTRCDLFHMEQFSLV
jgi:hypothetical protein